jgi:hypothetical protein
MINVECYLLNNLRQSLNASLKRPVQGVKNNVHIASRLMAVKKTDNQLLCEIYNRNPEEVNRFFASKQSVPLTHKSLEKWFLSKDGKQFYKFPKLMSLPLLRLAVLKGFYSWLSAAISESEFEKVLTTMDKILSEGVGKPETAAKMGSLIQHLKERKNMVLHSELLINIVAAQAIREDEQPDIYTNAIQLEKVDQIKELINDGAGYFFFQNIQLKTPIDFTKLTPTELTTLFHESKAVEAAFPEIMNLFHQEKKSSNIQPTLQNS